MDWIAYSGNDASFWNRGVSLPLPDQFPWQAISGVEVETGKGLLSKRAKEMPLDEFKVAIGNLIATAYPSRGELHLDHNLVYRCPCRNPHKLVWSWRFEIKLNSGGMKSNGSPSFGCHVLGLECTENKFGVRFMSDGTVKSGME